MRIRLLALLLLAGMTTMATAQSAAPIVWGEARFLGMTGCNGLPRWQPLTIEAWGDTLVAYALDSHPSGSDTDWVCTSYDNGLSHTPWIPIAGDGSVTSVTYGSLFASSHNRIYAFVEKSTSSSSDTWMRISSDYGLSWGPPIQSFPSRRSAGCTVGAEVYRSFFSMAPWPNRRESLQYSSDGGLTWTPPVVFDTTYYNPTTIPHPVACTRSKVMMATITGDVPSPTQERLERVHVATGTRQGQNLSIFRPIPDWPLWTAPSYLALAADTSSETAIVIEARGDRLTLRDHNQPILHRTTDGGETWEPYISLSQGEWVSQQGMIPANFCRGKLWVLAYQYCDPVTPEIFIMVWFSANHGKSWYPQVAAADSALAVITMMGQFHGNEVRLYWTQFCGVAGGWDQGDFRTVTGVFTPDTLPPVLSSALLLPDTLALGDTLTFGVDVQENDTLYEVALRLWSEEGMDTLLRLTRADSCRWQGTYVVTDTGHYHYRYEAEDLWEQRTLWPDSEGVTFVIPAEPDAADPLSLHPSSFSLSVYPNPFNSATEIRYAVPRAGHVSLTVFDVLGREVSVLVDEVRAAGEQRAAFDARGLASGIYFVRLDAGEMRVTRKVLLVR